MYSIDCGILRFFNSTLSCGICDYIMSAVTHIGTVYFALLLGLVLMFIPRRRYRVAGLVLFAAFLLGREITDILKEMVARPRPFPSLDWVCLGAQQGGFSFPSGHTTAAFLMAYVMAWSFKEYKWYIYGLATLVGVSRLYLGVHYPSDVLVGALVGLGAAAFVVSVARQVLSPDGGFRPHHHHNYNHHDRNRTRHEARRDYGKVVKGATPAPAAPVPGGKPENSASKPQNNPNKRRFYRKSNNRGRHENRPHTAAGGGTQ